MSTELHTARVTPVGRILHESDYYRVEKLARSSILRVTRSSRPFDSAAAVDLACNPVQRALDAAGRRNHALLVDTRAAIGRNDPASEKMFQTHRREMAIGFRRVAVLVSTPVGLLHSKRLLAEDGTGEVARVFIDEQEALTYLAGDPPHESTRE